MVSPTYRRPEKVLVFLYRRPSGPAPEGHWEPLQYLLLQRHPERTASGDIWQTVAGNLHWDEDRIEAARREVLQETGIALQDQIVPLGFTFSYPIHLLDGQQSWYPPDVMAIHNAVFASEVIGDPPIVLCSEHIDCGWFAYAEAAERLYWLEEKEALSRLHPLIAAQR
jgi:8-oxo-dGTP pyrophosphatase MutT (NUDIX family)